MKVACPTCGAEVEFRYDDSFVRVCDSCRAAVVRGDRGVETLGTIADLTPTASPLKLFASGRYQGQGFMLVGRAQYRHPAGGIWDEWYAKLDDQRWGWLAEAQGRFYLTFETLGAGEPPPWAEVFPGASVQLEDDGPKLFTVGERGVAELLAAAGEIPFRFQPGAKSGFADLSAPGGRFATIDYGDPDDDEDGVTIYVGRQVSLRDLGIAGGEDAAVARAVPGQRLACPSCDGAVELRAPDQSKRVVCSFCSALLDCEGPLAVLETLPQAKLAGPLALGAKGTFDGVTYTLIGRLQREVHDAGEVFLWDEHLLYEPTIGFRWLVESNGHWSFVTTLPPDAVDATNDHAPRYGGRSFRLYDASSVTVSGVWGEMYWRVAVGEQVDSTDFVAPPAMLSRELSADELNWSLGVYLTPAQVQRAFALPARLPSPTGVAPQQPFKHRHATRAALLLGAAFLLVTCGRLGMAGERVVFEDTVRLAEPPAEAVPPELQGTTLPTIAFTPSFKLLGDENVEVQLEMPVNQSWAFVAADLVNEASGAIDSFEAEISYYSGYEGGESWSEGGTSTRHFLPAVAAGSYVLRLEVQQPPSSTHGYIRVRVRQDVFRWKHALIALILVGLPGLLLGLWQWSFERKRWSNSDHAPAGLASGGDE